MIRAGVAKPLEAAESLACPHPWCPSSCPARKRRKVPATKTGQDAGVQARCVAPSPALGRPSGADHEEQQPELIGLDATRSWRFRGPFCPRSRPDSSPQRRPALKPLFSRVVRSVAWNAVRCCGFRSRAARWAMLENRRLVRPGATSSGRHPNSTPQTPSRVRPNPDHPRRREVARRYCVARNTPCLAATSPLSGPAVRFFGEVSRTTAPNRPGSHPISRIPTYFQPANIPAGGVTEGFPPVADAVPWRFSRAFQLAAIGGDLTVFRRAGHGVTPAHFFGGAVFRSAAGAPWHAPKPGITPGFAPSTRRNHTSLRTHATRSGRDLYPGSPLLRQPTASGQPPANHGQACRAPHNGRSRQRPRDRTTGECSGKPRQPAVRHETTRAALRLGTQFTRMQPAASRVSWRARWW